MDPSLPVSGQAPTAHVAGVALRSIHGDAEATLAALAADTPGPVGVARLSSDPIALLADLGAQACSGNQPDLVVFASTKGDLPRWLAAIHAGHHQGHPGSVADELGRRFGCPALAVSAACASALAALGLAAQRIRSRLSRRVLVLAADVATDFIVDGFTALRAIDPAGAHPYDAARAGLALGEVAGAVLLSADGNGPILAGWGGSLDANHLTGPCRDGGGLALACRRALAQAGCERPDLVIGHGTATRYNDDAESLAYAAIAPDLPVVGCKGGLGHSLGACGIAEILLATTAISQGWIPGTAGLRVQGTAGAIRALPPGRHPFAGSAVLCANAGFGGINHAVVLLGNSLGEASPSSPGRGSVAGRFLPVRQLELPSGDFQQFTAQQVLGRIDTGWGRMDAACRGLVALAMLAGELPEGTGMVLLTTAGCAASDRQFDLHRRQPGGDPQRFPYTLSTTAIGEASIRRHWRGPGLCLPGASDEQGRAVAGDLLAQGTPAVLLARIEADAPPHLGWAEIFIA